MAFPELAKGKGMLPTKQNKVSSCGWQPVTSVMSAIAVDVAFGELVLWLSSLSAVAASNVTSSGVSQCLKALVRDRCSMA